MSTNTFLSLHFILLANLEYTLTEFLLISTRAWGLEYNMFVQHTVQKWGLALSPSFDGKKCTQKAN